MREGITTTETLKNKIITPEEKPSGPNERVSMDASRYAELKHVQKTFATKFDRIDQIVKNMEKEIAELKELNEACKDRAYKYMRF